MDKIINLGYIGVGGQKGYVFRIDGLCPCLPASQWKDPTKVVVYESNRVRIHRKGNRQTSE